MNDSPPMDAILYGRVSTSQQETNRQDFQHAEYCHRRNLTPVLAVKDDATSGSIPFAERTAGRQIIQFIKSRGGRPFALVATEQDRIGRDTIDIINTLRLVWQYGGTPHFTAEGGSMARDPENEMRMEIRATLSQYERNKIRQRINDKMRSKRAAGQLCGTIPYGWSAEPTGEVTAKGKAIRRLVDNPEELKWILQMFHWRAAGHGYHTIAKFLNSHGVPTKRRGEMMNLLRDGTTAAHVEAKFASGKWQAGNVANILNPKNVTVQAWLASQAVPKMNAA